MRALDIPIMERIYIIGHICLLVLHAKEFDRFVLSGLERTLAVALATKHAVRRCAVTASMTGVCVDMSREDVHAA